MPTFLAPPLRVITRDPHPPLHRYPEAWFSPGLVIYNSSFIWRSQSCSLFHSAIAHFTEQSRRLLLALIQISLGHQILIVIQGKQPGLHN